MVANRGYSSTDNRSRQALIEAAARLLEEEGAHAISARRVAYRAGLKPQLVHYYFRTMEDLLVAAFRHATAEYLQQHDAALAAPQPLHALWDLNSRFPAVRRNMAFLALGAIHPNLRREMKASGEHFRKLQQKAVERIFTRIGIDEPTFTPASVTMMMSAVSRTLAMEGQIGVETGHAELRQLVESFLDRIEPPDTQSELTGVAYSQQ